MSEFKLFINTDNAAFDPNPEFEVARLLKTVAYRIEHDGDMDFRTIRDNNGNTCGEYGIYE